MNNQPFLPNNAPVLEEYNLYSSDQILQELLGKSKELSDVLLFKEFGDLFGSANMIKNGFLANKHTPEFHSHDRFGKRTDHIEYHPAYHKLMDAAIESKVHSLPWLKQENASHVDRMALFYMYCQNETGTACPITMTFASVPALSNHLPQAAEWIPKIISNTYDPRNIPFYEKKGLTIGMAMTEKQGGTDVRKNLTTAQPVDKPGPGQPYLITGHKWFCSAPMCDAFLVLAQTELGLSCFLMPRWKPDGKKNPMQIQRLKDKLGNRSNASSEIEFYEAWAWMVGEPGRGVPTIIEMVAMTRYDCMTGSAGLMRKGVSEVINHINHREVSGKKLIDHPLMQNVVADMCLEVEAALLLSHRAAVCLDREGDRFERMLLRLILPVGKYWITKRTTNLLAEAMECLGGNGYVEESILPRLFREAPVNAIWEGSGNVQCLDVIRAISRSPEVLEAFIEELGSAQGQIPVYDRFTADLIDSLHHSGISAFAARVFTERMAKAVQAAQFIKQESPFAEAFCRSRLVNNGGLLFGNLDESIDCNALINRFFQLKKE